MEEKLQAGSSAEQARAAVDAVYRSDSRRVFATLIRLLGLNLIAAILARGANSAPQW